MASYARASYLRWLQGDAEAAKVLIRQALLAGRDVKDPEPTAWTFVEAGMLFWQEGDYEGADAVFEEALKWVPELSRCMGWAGQGGLESWAMQNVPSLTWKMPIVVIHCRKRLGCSAMRA